MKSGVMACNEAQCKCGWHGTTYYGQGSQSKAWIEYRYHKKTACPLWPKSIKKPNPDSHHGPSTLRAARIAVQKTKAKD